MAHKAGEVGNHRNVVLAGVLDELRWSSGRVASAINAILGTGYIARSTVSEWVNCSRLPREPLPMVVAHVLSMALSTNVSAQQLWPGWVCDNPQWVPADAGTDVGWTPEGTRALIHDWLANGRNVMDTDRRHFMAISGTAATAPAWAYTNNINSGTPSPNTSPAVWGSTDRAAFTVSPAYVHVIENTIAGLRRMDDSEGGGGDSLRAAYREFRTVADLLHNGRFSDTNTAQRLTATFAQLCQSARWMALDAQQHGLAWRYFRTGLQAAHHSEDHDIGAHILGSMSYQASTQGHPHDALQLATTATETAKKSHPLVQAAVLSRLAHAQAAAGNAYEFRSAADQMKRSFQQAQTPNAQPPNYLYWFDDVAIDTLTGQGALLLALMTSGRNSNSLTREADTLLSNEVSQNAALRPRYAVLHGAWLARLHLRRGDVEHAIDTVGTALHRLRSVRSPMTITVLRNLDKDLSNLRQGRHLPEVRALRQQLHSALAA